MLRRSFVRTLGDRPTACIENLEDRRLMAAAPLAAVEVEWNGQTHKARPDAWLVKFDDVHGKKAEQVNAANAKLAKAGKGLKATRQLGADGLFQLEAPAGSKPAEVRAAVAKLPGFKSLEPDFVLTTQATTPNDTYYAGHQWGLNNAGQTGGTADADIDAPEAWDLTTGSSAVAVGVIDSGVDYNHPDLAANIWTNPGEVAGNGVDDDANGYVDDVRGWDFFNRDNDPMDDNGHGSHVAGTIAARGNDSFGIPGITWKTGLMPLRALDSTGLGVTSDIAAAFTYAARNGADVVNASLGGSGYSLTLLNAINNAPNTLFVVAAGNEANNNDTSPQYPCSYNVPNLVCVGASDQNDNLASFSNYGAASVDLAAPGVSILSIAPALATPFSESFEVDLAGRWVTGGINNLWGRMIDTQGGYITDSPGLDYLSDTDSWIATANSFSLAGQSDCRLLYSLKLATEKGQDALIVELSRDGENWTKIAGWSGSSEGSWMPRSEDAKALDGASSVFARFRLRTNSSIDGAGVDIDNVRMQCQSDTYNGTEFRTMSGTSMAAPHVAGVAALLKAAAPQTTVAGMVSALVSGVDSSSALVGKVSSGGRLSAVGSLMAVGVSGFGGSEVPPTEPLPEPLPTTEPEPEPTNSPAPQPEPEPTNSPAPEPEPTTSPAPEPEPEPAPTLAPTPEPVAADHWRRTTLRLRGALVAKGRVTVESGYAACAANVPVRIKRNGKLVKKTTTDADGYYRVKLANRKGRYRAFALQTTVEDLAAQTCLWEPSPVRRRL